jgi:hypothetical protein
MSNISVNTITDASGGSTASINGLTPQASNMQPFNRIINGAMTIDQRNAGAAVTPANAGYTLDRWKTFVSQSSKFTIQQNAGSVTPPSGFTNYLGVTSTASTSVGAGDFFFIDQRIEGFNTSDLGFGTANAQSITISFWVRSSLTGTFTGGLVNSSNSRGYGFTYAISSANTWENKTVTIAGDTSGTWLTTSGVGLTLIFGFGCGATYTTPTNGSWQAVNSFAGGSGGVNVVGTSGATFYITGVQLEAGSTASPFAHENYADTLQKCQRYYYKYVASSGSSGFFAGYASTTSTADGIVSFPTTMRAPPAALETTGTAANYRVRYLNTAASCTSVPTFFIADVGSSHVRFPTGGLTAGGGIVGASNAAADVAFLAWSAEL